jgi:hypothetical protein
MGDSLLSGVSRSSLLDTATINPALTPLQAQVDVMVGSSSDQLTQLNFVASSLVGAAAYGLIRYGSLKKIQAVFKEMEEIRKIGAFERPLASLGSYSQAMIGGSAAYELTGRSLLSLEGKGPENSDLLRLSGGGGILMGVIESTFAFGPTLIAGEAAGRLGRLFSKGSPRPVAIAGAGLMGILGFLVANKKLSDWNVEMGIAPKPKQEKKVN